MAGFLESIREFIAKLFGGGEKQKKLKALDAMESRFAAAKRDNEDKLRSHKDEIKELEAKALNKKKEHEKAHGDSKRIVAGEIERLFRELDRKRNSESIIGANLERISVAMSKVSEAKAALQAGVDEEQFDEIALEIQELFGELRTLDKAAEELDREKYEAPARSEVDVEQRTAELKEDEKAPTALSEETEKRLKQLEAEEE